MPINISMHMSMHMSIHMSIHMSVAARMGIWARIFWMVVQYIGTEIDRLRCSV